MRHLALVMKPGDLENYEGTLYMKEQGDKFFQKFRVKLSGILKFRIEKRADIQLNRKYRHVWLEPGMTYENQEFVSSDTDPNYKANPFQLIWREPAEGIKAKGYYLLDVVDHGMQPLFNKYTGKFEKYVDFLIRPWAYKRVTGSPMMDEPEFRCDPDATTVQRLPNKVKRAR